MASPPWNRKNLSIKQTTPFFGVVPVPAVNFRGVVLLMAEILHHLGCTKPYRYSNGKKLPINWCRISAMNSMFHVVLVFFVVISPRIFPGFEDAAKEISGLACDSVNGWDRSGEMLPVYPYPETNIFVPENGWLECDRFLLRAKRPIFRGELLVSGRVSAILGGLRGECCFVYVLLVPAIKTEDVSTWS